MLASCSCGSASPEEAVSDPPPMFIWTPGNHVCCRSREGFLVLDAFQIEGWNGARWSSNASAWNACLTPVRVTVSAHLHIGEEQTTRTWIQLDIMKLVLLPKHAIINLDQMSDIRHSKRAHSIPNTNHINGHLIAPTPWHDMHPLLPLHKPLPLLRLGEWDGEFITRHIRRVELQKLGEARRSKDSYFPYQSSTGPCRECATGKAEKVKFVGA
jgi:hypothetical protein